MGEKTSKIPNPPHVLIVTESIFSMDGDAAPLARNRRAQGKIRRVAHGGRGARHRPLSAKTAAAWRTNWRQRQIEIQMGTLGKALGASGGYICGSRALIDFLINRARSFIFSTAPVPAAAAAATAAIQFVQSSEGETRAKSFGTRCEQLNSKRKAKSSNFRSAIIPVMIGDESHGG
jgi:8-amino-7-oxononanoate synthase